MFMSYCRFQNTALELRYCINDLEDDGLPEGDDELNAAKKMYKLAQMYIEAYEELTDN